MRNTAFGVLVILAWYAVGLAWNTQAIDLLVTALIGGNFEPPVLWMRAWQLGYNVLPFFAVLGGVPTAVQVARGKPFKRVLISSIAIVYGAWVAVLFVVFVLPSLLGWYW